MLGRGGILLCPRGFPAVTVRLKLRDGAAKSPCTCGLDSEIYTHDTTEIRKIISRQRWTLRLWGRGLRYSLEFSICDHLANDILDDAHHPVAAKLVGRFWAACVVQDCIDD